MPTYTALTTLPDPSKAQALGDAMETLTPEPTGIGVFEVEDGSGLYEVGGYFIEPPDQAGLALLASMHGARPFAVSELPDRDWVALVKRELSPVYAGRFVVYGGHHRGNVPDNLIGLEIEAAMAFGTGHHGTTKGCLLSYDKLLKARMVARNVADIGAGTAVLAMAAARSGAAQVLASDIDPIATQTALANVAANTLQGKVQCVTATGFRHPLIRRRAPYDLIFANILAGPLKGMAADMAAHAGAGTVLILSGILNEQARGVENIYAGHGFHRLDRRTIGEWTTLTLRR